jgi:fatty acid desaturase
MMERLMDAGRRVRDDKALLQRLHAEVAAIGALARPSGRSWRKFLLLIGGMLGAIALMTVLPWWSALVLLPTAALFTTAAAMMGHEAIHRSACASRLGNRLMAIAAFQLIGGHGERFWRYKHNRSHHGQPNVVGADVDLTLWPLALSSADYRASWRPRRWFQRYLQGFLFWPMTMVVVFQMRIDTLKYLVKQTRQGHLDRALLEDTAGVLGHYLLWLVLPSLLFGVVPTLLFYVGLWALVGGALAALFTVGHIGLSVVTAYQSNLRLQMETSRSIRMGRFLSCFAIGLDYQLEHHLFPRVSHFHLPAVARVVKDFAAREGLPYHEVKFAAALGGVTHHMTHAWRIQPISLDPVELQ